eukprot:4133326-Prymnesium_polylepis.1
MGSIVERVLAVAAIDKCETLPRPVVGKLYPAASCLNVVAAHADETIVVRAVQHDNATMLEPGRLEAVLAVTRVITEHRLRPDVSERHPVPACVRLFFARFVEEDSRIPAIVEVASCKVLRIETVESDVIGAFLDEHHPLAHLHPCALLWFLAIGLVRNKLVSQQSRSA